MFKGLASLALAGSIFAGGFFSSEYISSKAHKEKVSGMENTITNLESKASGLENTITNLESKVSGLEQANSYLTQNVQQFNEANYKLRNQISYLENFEFYFFNINTNALQNRIDKDNSGKNGVPDKHALLITGDLHKMSYIYNISLAYQVLLESGFKRDNIYVLAGGETPIYPSDGLATKENVTKTLLHFAKKVDDKDMLFIYMTDHGSREMSGEGEYDDTKVQPGEIIPKGTELSSLYLHGNFLSELEMAKLLEKIDSKRTIMLTDICYGGGFANRFSYGKYVGISSALEHEESASDNENSFGRHFMMAHRNLEESDKNKDGRVSILEAFFYARDNHPLSKPAESEEEYYKNLELFEATQDYNFYRHFPDIRTEDNPEEIYLDGDDY